MIKYFYFISLNFIFKFQWSFQNFFNFWDQIIWLHNFTEFFLFHLLQMWWHILLMYHHLLIHGDGLWYAKKMTLYLFIIIFFNKNFCALNSGFRPTNIDWCCWNGQKNWSKNRWKIALSRWCLVPFIYHHEQGCVQIVCTYMKFNSKSKVFTLIN
jgi:hypothetical protein